MASAETDTSRRASRSTCNQFEAVKAKAQIGVWVAELYHLAGEEAVCRHVDECLERLKRIEAEKPAKIKEIQK